MSSNPQDDVHALEPVDLLVAMKIAAAAEIRLSPRELAEQLGVPESAVMQSMQRLTALKIVRPEESGWRINRLAFRDLMEHGVRWIAPGEVGDFDLGLPTSHMAEPLASHLRSDPDPLVMPLPHGPVRGRAVTPIHPMAPRAATKDEKLYRLLVIADAFRIGRARDREVAKMELRRAV